MCTLSKAQRPGKSEFGASGRTRVPPHIMVLVAAAALAHPASSTAQTRRDSVTAKVDAVFADVNTTSSPGCSLGVIRDGTIVYARGYGMANLDEDIALSPASAFYIASTSKQFAAASALLLAQEGKLSLDDDIRKYVPELPDYHTPVTVRQLIHHTSGLRDYLGLMALGADRPENVLTDDDIIALIARQKTLNFTPGAEYSYSNSGYFLLGVIVKRVSGTSLREYADSHIFRPLGMLHTHFHDDRLQPIRHRVIGYDPAPNGGFLIDFFGNFQGVGDGGLWATVEDLALWDRNFDDPKVGGPGLLKEQLTPGRLNNGDTISYGGGLMFGRYRGLETVSHGGAFMGYRTEFLRFPDRRFSVICLCNRSTENPTARARKVADIYLASEFPRSVATADAAPPSFIEVEQSALRALAGMYRNSSTQMVWDVSVRDGRLTAGGFGVSIPLGALSRSHFRSTGGPIPLDLEFELRPAGEATRLAVSVGGPDAKPDRFERIDRVALTAAQLAQYAGQYRSSELRATYAFTAIGDSLFVEIPNRPRQALAPTLRDAFVGAGTGFTFLRDSAMHVSAVVVWAPQDRNIRFERVSKPMGP